MWTVLVVAVVVLWVVTLFRGPSKADLVKIREALGASGALLLDVRTPGEFAGGRLEGAINIPVGELARRLEELGARDRPVVIYCRSGARSATAAGVLRRAGFADVHDLGGLGSGAAAGLTIVR